MCLKKHYNVADLYNNYTKYFLISAKLMLFFEQKDAF